jgi:hypothetical protein
MIQRPQELCKALVSPCFLSGITFNELKDKYRCYRNIYGSHTQNASKHRKTAKIDTINNKHADFPAAN